MTDDLDDWEAAERAAEQVHVLEGGLPTCHFSLQVPSEWPRGHRWVRREEVEKATCKDCRSASVESLVEERDRWRRVAEGWEAVSRKQEEEMERLKERADNYRDEREASRDAVEAMHRDLEVAVQAREEWMRKCLATEAALDAVRRGTEH